MTRQHIFPLILCALYIGAAVMYASVGDYRRCCYFIGALILNASLIS